MQITIKFLDDRHTWGALELARLLCDLQHLATAISGLPANDLRGLPSAQRLDPKYEQMIVADFTDQHPIWLGEKAKVVLIRKASPLEIVVGIFLSAGSTAAIAAVVRAVCRTVLDLQRIRRERASADRAEFRALRERLHLEKDYIKLRNSLASDDERRALDHNFAAAMMALVDGRYPPLGTMKLRISRRR